jgi:hypothetical protein
MAKKKFFVLLSFVLAGSGFVTAQADSFGVTKENVYIQYDAAAGVIRLTNRNAEPRSLEFSIDGKNESAVLGKMAAWEQAVEAPPQNVDIVSVLSGGKPGKPPKGWKAVKLKPYTPLPIRYKEASLSELNTATAAEGTGFIVESYIGCRYIINDNLLPIADYKYNDTLSRGENEDLEKKGTYASISFHTSSEPEKYVYSTPRQFETYYKDGLYNRVERGKNIKYILALTFTATASTVTSTASGCFSLIKLKVLRQMKRCKKKSRRTQIPLRFTREDTSGTILLKTGKKHFPQKKAL